MKSHSKSDNPHTRAIAKFASGLTYENIPAEVRERIKLLMLDSLDCAIYGANFDWCRILPALDNLDATRTTSIWGTSEAPRGSERSFTTTDDIVAKFRKLTRGVMADKQGNALVDSVLGLDNLSDSRTLIELLRA